MPGDAKIDWLDVVCGDALVRISEEEVEVCVVTTADVLVVAEASFLLTPYEIQHSITTIAAVHLNDSGCNVVDLNNMHLIFIV